MKSSGPNSAPEPSWVCLTLMLLSIISSFLIAFLSPLLVRVAKARSGWLLALLPLGLSVYFSRFLVSVADGATYQESYSWLPQLGVSFSFYLDGLSLLFALLVSVIGTFVVIYAGGYLKDDPALARFYLVLLTFMAAMLGLVLSDNLITLFIFWELTSVTSFFLIGHKHAYEDARKSALQALLVTGAGALAMLAGFLLLGLMAGDYTVSALTNQGELLKTHALYPAALVLVLLGAFTKSAQFPFHFWLPNAMAAPTPVSAYLHSATMVKAGIYLIARLSPALGGTELWLWLLGGAGMLTVLTAGILALKQTDIKKLLAYSTLAALGMLTMLLGVGTSAAVKAALVFLLAHSLYKASLFMVAGILDHETGTRDVLELSGLWRVMPITFVAALFAALSTAGLPPKLGFIAKELAYEGLLEHPVLLTAAVLSNAALFTVAALVSVKPFLGRLHVKRFDNPKEDIHGAAFSLWLGPLTLALLGLTFGLFPELIEVTKLPAVASVLGKAYDFDLYLFPSEVTPALILSIVTVGLGSLIFLLWRSIYQGLTRLEKPLDIGPARGYAWALAGLIALAEWQTRVLQAGPRSDHLRHHLGVTLGFAVVLSAATALLKGGLSFDINLADLSSYRIYEYTLLAIIALGALATVLAKRRLAAVTALGAVGFATALTYLVFGAPDLAITQFLVETLLVIITVLAMLRLPELTPAQVSATTSPSRLRDAGLAVLGGALVTGLVLSVTALPFDHQVTDFYEANSYPEAFGRNVVNVILVDFRALDTLGEVTVLASAALGVAALVRAVLRRSGRAK